MPLPHELPVKRGDARSNSASAQRPPLPLPPGQTASPRPTGAQNGELSHKASPVSPGVPARKSQPTLRANSIGARTSSLSRTGGRSASASSLKAAMQPPQQQQQQQQQQREEEGNFAEQRMTWDIQAKWLQSGAVPCGMQQHLFCVRACMCMTTRAGSVAC